MLVDSLKPRLVLCGHMHRYYRQKINRSDGGITQVCCLANTRKGSDAVEVFCLSSDGGIESLRSPGKA